MLSFVVAMIVLSLLVIVHELGHLLVARWSGVRVLSFSVGFGPRILSWRWGGIEYLLSLFPLGGYVKLSGEQETGATPSPDDFVAQPPGVRARIIMAGPLVNYLTSIVTLWAVLVMGYPELVPAVGPLMPEMPAQAAGIQTGDRITAVGQTPVKTWDELTAIVHHSAGTPLEFHLTRDGQPRSITITPTLRRRKDPFGRPEDIGLIGISPSGAFETYRLSPRQAVKKTIAKQKEGTSQMFLSLWSLVAGRVSAQESLTGPIGIIYMTSEAARMGLGSLLYLMSVFSLSLAIFNFFPMPILDGGHLLFLALEKLRGRPVSLQAQERATQVSLAFLLLLAVFVCVNDVNRFGLVSKFLEWWKG